MAKSPPSSPFYWNDYYRDTRLVSPAARGIWMDILCRLHESGRRGEMTLPLSAWISWCSCPQEALEAAFREIAGTEVGIIRFNQLDLVQSVPSCPSDITVPVTVVSRRMVREQKAREAEKLKKQRQRRPADFPKPVPSKRQLSPPAPSSAFSFSPSDGNPLNPPSRGTAVAPGDEDGEHKRDGLMSRMSGTLRQVFGQHLGVKEPEAVGGEGAA